jgi:hypothetical protein
MTEQAKPRRLIVLNDTDLRKIKIRIEGFDGNKSNSTCQISVLAENINVVRARIIEALRRIP